MTSHNKGIAPPKAAEKRRFKRHVVRLEGVCHLDGGVSIGCEIQDVCLNGMYIVFRKPLDQQPHTTPTINDIVQLECFLPAGKDMERQTLHINSRIARYYQNGAGLVFNQPDKPTLKSLHDYINRTLSESVPSAGREASTLNHQATQPSHDQLIETCQKFLIDLSKPIVSDFLTTIDKKLFVAAREAKNNAEQSSLFDTMGIFKKSEQLFTQTFLNDFLNQLQSSLTDSKSDTSRDNPTESELSIMGDDNFENWLAVKNIITHIQSEHHELLKDLEQRLIELFQTRINSDNNPFGPALYANAFDNALQRLDLDHDMNLFSYTVFKEIITKSAYDLYTSINQFLDENGIQPRLEADIKEGEFQPPETDQDDASSATENDTSDGSINASESKHPALHHRQAGGASTSQPETQSQNTANEITNEQQGNQPLAESPNHGMDTTTDIPQTYASHDTAARHDNIEQQNIYQLVQELRQLKQQIRKDEVINHKTTPNHTNANSVASREENIQTAQFTTDEIMRALSVLQEQNQSPSSNHPISRDFETRTLDILDEQHLTTGITKRIGERDSSIMDVTKNLFDSLLHDMLVENSVRQWIKKLEIPLLKMALQDDSLFSDKNHVARQVVNKISQLEGYTNDGGTDSHNAISKKIDNILSRIVDNIDTNPGIFNQALNEVDAMIKIQDQAYKENIQDVVQESDQNYKNHAQTRNIIDNKQQWQPWEKQAHRLNVGDWLLFSHSSSRDQRLRLAWVSLNHDYFVFVNLKGLKEIALDLNELSQRLRDSTAIILESADEPALDRAQYSILDNLHKQLIYESTHDQLTGLINRREFEHTLNNILSNNEEVGCQHVLCYLDIDQFGIINSSYGYDAGDKLLVEFSDILLRNLNGKATLSRVNGDAFALFLENKTAAEARNIINFQIDNLKDYRFQWEDNKLVITLNISLVPITDFKEGASELLRIAEMNCRTAKQTGSKKIHVYQRDDKSSAQNQNIIEQVMKIDHMLENGNIELHCQRIAPIQTGNIDQPHHSEVLISIKDDQGNMIPTQDFILAAEHYKRITVIDRWVIANTLEWMSEHKDIMAGIGGMAINLSGISVNDESFLNDVLDLIANSDVPREWICFEITETAGITNLSDATEFINKIKETGCHFSLDDFGSGLSSYSYLKNLPVDYLKIDGIFVKEMHKNPDDHAVVKSICEIGHFMGKKIIAEFVENDTILEQLKTIGIDYAQGYGIDKPKPLNDLINKTKRGRLD